MANGPDTASARNNPCPPRPANAARRAEEPWGAAFVLYRPDRDAVERNLAVVRELGGTVLLVDNTPEPAVEPAWAAARGAELLFNGNRDGIAGALEEGCRWALSGGLRWLLTMDQDSDVREEWLVPLLRARALLPEDAAILSAEHAVDEAAFDAPRAGGTRLRRLRVVMTSGNLLRVEAWRNSPGFDRSLFIDQVDHDFCLKLGRAGFTIWRLDGAKMRHPLGETRKVRFLGRDLSVHSHPPFRWRTIARNVPRVAFRHFLFAPGFAVRELRTLFEMFSLMLLFEDERLAKAAEAARGFRDLLLGRSGEPR